MKKEILLAALAAANQPVDVDESRFGCQAFLGEAVAGLR